MILVCKNAYQHQIQYGIGAVFLAVVGNIYTTINYIMFKFHEICWNIDYLVIQYKKYR